MEEIIKKFPEEIVFKSQNIKMIVVAMEGVLSSSSVHVNAKSTSYTFNLLDDIIVKPLRENGIILVAIAHHSSEVLKRKAKELSYDDYIVIGATNHQLLEELCEEFEVSLEQICFIGFDLLDVVYLKKSGLSISPADSVEYLKSNTNFTTKAKGGEGVLREVADLILASQDKLKDVFSSFLDR